MQPGERGYVPIERALDAGYRRASTLGGTATNVLFVDGRERGAGGDRGQAVRECLLTKRGGNPCFVLSLFGA